MTIRVLASCSPLLLLLVGCVEAHRGRLVSGGPSATQLPRGERVVNKAPATEEADHRVRAAGQRLVLANPQIGFRPIFITVGLPEVEIFHRGGGVDAYQIFVSEGLARRCSSEDQLAAVLAMEIGKIVSEREASMGSRLRQRERPPIAETVGRDTGGTFGPADGTRMMEMAHYDRQMRQPLAAPPVPEVLARGYLSRAGIEPATLAAAAPILREAQDHSTAEKSIMAPAIIPAAGAPVTVHKQFTTEPIATQKPEAGSVIAATPKRPQS